MNISEKILNLRKANNLTQEELADKLNISRQSVSKWESEQAVPDVDKLLALSEIFKVSTDYLLKPSEIDELSIKTEILEKQQKELMQKEDKRNKIIYCCLSCLAIYLVFFAAYFVGHFYFRIWNPSVIFSEFLVATAIAIYVCLKHNKKSNK
jgi:transcriptional regulator with XRE-family HTH domain